MSQEIKFSKVYNEIQDRLKDSILSLWATGDAQFQEYLLNLFEKEKLLAEPVFQNTFPWTPARETFSDLKDLFESSFINNLDKIKDKEYKFPKDRNPYKHQIQSWKTLLKEKKSIAVTTGTGSGKTECFMLPVLQDLYENCKNEPGVRAIFLYPLNALIGSQKKRMDAWVKALEGLTYAVYNGNTDENATANRIKESKPELVSRKQIRDTPPQILFTNPSMLEYILVRDKDVPLLENSRGKLRWILLDEAHTLVGSAASEMAFLIRRVVDAFQVDVKDLRFAITSATVGTGEVCENSLKEFMANLCGIEKCQIEVITGQREFKELPLSFEIDNKDEIEKLRKIVYKSDSLTLSEISRNFISKNSTTYSKLNLVDNIVDLTYDYPNKLEDSVSILPLRAHLFSRGIGGVYACSNPYCDKHKDFAAKSNMGTLTTYAEKNCSHCNYPMFELVACRSCGNELLKAEKSLENNGNEFLRLSTSINQDNFIVDDFDNEEDQTSIRKTQSFFFTRKNTNKRFVTNTAEFSIESDGKLNRSECSYIEADNDGECVCPHCASSLENPLHFRISSSFMNRILSDIFLENTPAAGKNIRTEMLWDGHKYISFTDSRQGTAKISALINIDNENNWIRSQVFHLLWKTQLSMNQNNPNEALLNILYQNLNNTINPVQRREIQAQIDRFQTNTIENARLTWGNINEAINLNSSNLKTLFKNNNPREDNFTNLEKYARALLFDNFARRLPRERSLENLGMISIVYPDLDNVNLPRIAEQYKISIEEWKNLLKIGLDFIIRYQFYFFIDHSIYPYSTSFLKSFKIHNPDSKIANAKEWPKFSKSEARPNRLSLLICAGLGYFSRDEIDNTIEQDINEILREIWLVIRSRVLELDSSGIGYKLNLEEKTRIQIPEQLWLCPVKKRLIDVQFKGFSPWITGSFSEDNIRHFEIKEKQPFKFPKFQFPFNVNEENEVDLSATKNWIRIHSREWKDKGLWNDIHEKIILNRPLYLSGEHSAQQSEKRLKQLEDKFEKAEINILNCSTTMEMGVDIGGISTVVMNNVPPGPANYLQRAGRAGRRNESKSLAFTVCAPNPVGLNAFNTPSWALTHKIAPPFISFNSPQVIERHINAFFLGNFVQTDEIRGIRVTDKIENFFFDDNDPIAYKFISWLMSENVIVLASQIENITKNTSYADKNFSYLINKVFSNFNALLNKSKSKKDAFEKKLEELGIEFGVNSPAYKAVNIQFIQFKLKNALTYLAQEGFLPTAGLPTGVVEFETKNIDALNNPRQAEKENPSYFITRALTEFAPGNNIVIDGMNYRSSGIILDNNRGTQSTKDIIQLCKNCGNQRIVEIENNQSIDSKCPHCNHNSFRGLVSNNDGNLGTFTEMIQPAGFAVDIYQTPNRKISETSRVQYVDPLLINVNPWQQNSNNLFDIRESDENGEILYYNVGNGNGFHVCLHCGKTGLSTEELNDHRRLRGGRNENNDSACSGNLIDSALRANVIIGGRFKTDFSEIRIRIGSTYSNDESLLYSLGAIFVKELASYLAIEQSELEFGVKRYDNYKTIFLFDTTKGGAGYANQFFLYADEIFKEAQKKLKCDCQNACTKCLIDRKTQWHINLLDRNKAIDWLTFINSIKVPSDVTVVYPNAKRILGSVKQELTKLNYTSKIKEAWLFVKPEIKEWQIDNLLFLENLKSKIKVNIVFTESPIIKDDLDIMTLVQLATKTNIGFLIHTQSDDLNTIAMVKHLDDRFTHFFSNSKVDLSLTPSWGESTNGEAFSVFTNHQPSISNLDPLTLVKNSNIQEAYININSKVSSQNLAVEMLKGLKDFSQLEVILTGKTYNVSYSDRYLKTPFGCILMLQFLDALKNKFNFNIDEFTFFSQVFNNYRRPYLYFHEFENSESRDEFIKTFSYELNCNKVTINNASLPHYRYFELKNKEYKIIIRPDAGVEHGWRMTNNNIKIGDIDSLSNTFEIIKINDHPILYTISIEIF